MNADRDAWVGRNQLQPAFTLWEDSRRATSLGAAEPSSTDGYGAAENTTTYIACRTKIGASPTVKEADAMPDLELKHLEVLIANEKRDRLELLAQVVLGLGHDVIASEIYVKGSDRDRPRAP